ncbi:hypothetical protein FQZ97_938590 [compost metagenome]
MFRQALVEGRVEHRDVRQCRVERHGRFDAEQVRRIVQRRQRGGVADRLEHLGVDQAGMIEAFAAVHHAMADGVQFAVGGLVHQRQQLGEGGAVIAAGERLAVFLAVLLPVQHRRAGAQALGQAVQEELLLPFAYQGELDRRTAAVDHQDIACGHLPLLVYFGRGRCIGSGSCSFCGAPAACKGLADCGAALHRVEYPVAVLPGWLVAQVLSMAAGQYCHPLAVFVLTEVKQTREHRTRPSVSARVAFGRTLG